MRDVYEVLREREQAMERVLREVQVLRLAVRLLGDESDAEMPPVAPLTGRRPAEASSATPPDEAETADAVRSGAKKVSARLKRLATPLLQPGRVAS